MLISIVSTRLLERQVFNSFIYEFEDMVATVESARMLQPRTVDHGSIGSLPLRAYNAVLSRIGLAHKRVGIWRTLENGMNAEVFLVNVLSPLSLDILNATPRWRARCEKAACVVFELWPAAARDLPLWLLRTLDHFDHVFVANAAACEILQARLSVPVSYLTYGVDAFRFCPPSLDSPRPIALQCLGRRSDATHEACLSEMRQRGSLYYCTVQTGGTIQDPQLHQLQKAELIQRTEFFIVYTHNDCLGLREKTGGVEELSLRYFEGAAGGAVLLGSSPKCRQFSEYFGYRDAVIALPYECGDLRDRLKELRADPQRLAQCRRNAVRNTLLKNDWSYRWSEILAKLGLEPTVSLAARQAALRARASGM